MKIALCTIAKNENLYIREWVEWYKNIGIDKIFLYDNNDICGERFEDVISDYINDGFVSLINCRGEKKYQLTAYIDFYNKISSNYDWCCFFDVDEFLYLTDDANIKEYLQRDIFKKYDSIAINWKNYGDSNLVGDENNYDRACVKRFTKECKTNDKYNNEVFKKIIRGGLRKISKLESPHTFSPSLDKNTCNNKGEKVNSKHFKIKEDFTLAYLKHFCTKTILEYILKSKRGGGVNGITKAYSEINNFFNYNRKTKRKESIINYFFNDSNVIKLCVVNFNTPLLIDCLIKNIKLQVKSKWHLYIFDNSDKEQCVKYENDNITVFDNTHGDIINFDEWLEKFSERFNGWAKNNNWASAKHCYSVEKCMSLIDDNFILLDSDILLTKDISEIYKDDMFYIGEIAHIKSQKQPRISPYLCFINTKLCKLYNIHYFYEDYMHGLSDAGKDYDTGTAFYKFVNKYQHININVSDYAVHFGQGSWQTSASTTKLLKKNYTLNDWLNQYMYLYEDCSKIKSKLISFAKKHYKNLELNLDCPTTIQDKINWLKIYDNSLLKTQCTDKILLHEYCKKILKKDICVPILKIFNNENDINVNELPDSFVIKCNHGCAYNIIVKNKNSFNLHLAKEKIHKWLSEDFSEHWGYEPQYKFIVRHCYAEQYLGEIADYKFWCFNGKVKFWTYSEPNNGLPATYINYYDTNCILTDINNLSHPRNENIKVSRPMHFDEMIKISTALSKEFKFVRVDLYEVNDKVYLGELTFTPGSGFINYDKQTSIKLGKMLNLGYDDLSLYDNLNKPKSTNKVLLCAIVKNENLYIEEWVKHYQNLGVNKIVIYDNDDIEAEYIENVPYIKQLIDSNYIDVYHIPDKVAWQKEAYTECYQKYNKEYDWLMFFDIDEYLILENSITINEELAKQQFAKYDMIHVNWKIYDDNNLIKCENNYSVVNRFTHPMNKNLRANREIKSIIRGNLEKIEFTLNPHTITTKILACCDPLGNKVLSVNKYNNNICHKEMWLNHYICKTAEEFITIKLKRLGGSTKHEIGLRYNLEFFFLYNEKTPEKLKYFKDEIAKNFNETDSKKILKHNIYKPENLSKKLQTDDSITIKIINKPTIVKTLEPYKLPVKSITRRY